MVSITIFNAERKEYKMQHPGKRIGKMKNTYDRPSAGRCITVCNHRHR